MTHKLHHDAKPAPTGAPAGSSDLTPPVGAEALPLVGGRQSIVDVGRLTGPEHGEGNTRRAGQPSAIRCRPTQSADPAQPESAGEARAYIAIGNGYIALVDRPVDQNCWVDL
jgi:hypothetical protein